MLQSIRYQGWTYRVYPLRSEGSTLPVFLVPRLYDGANLAVEVMRIEYGFIPVPHAWLTRDVEGETDSRGTAWQSDRRAYLDTVANPWAETFLREHGIAYSTHRSHRDAEGRSLPLYYFLTNGFFAEE